MQERPEARSDSFRVADDLGLILFCEHLGVSRYESIPIAVLMNFGLLRYQMMKPPIKTQIRSRVSWPQPILKLQRAR